MVRCMIPSSIGSLVVARSVPKRADGDDGRNGVDSRLE
jgi:hypothetical protein